MVFRRGWGAGSSVVHSRRNYVIWCSCQRTERRQFSLAVLFLTAVVTEMWELRQSTSAVPLLSRHRRSRTLSGLVESQGEWNNVSKSPWTGHVVLLNMLQRKRVIIVSRSHCSHVTLAFLYQGRFLLLQSRLTSQSLGRSALHLWRYLYNLTEVDTRQPFWKFLTVSRLPYLRKSNNEVNSVSSMTSCGRTTIEWGSI